MIKQRIKNYSQIIKFDFDVILELIGYKMTSRKVLKPNGIRESHLTA